MEMKNFDALVMKYAADPSKKVDFAALKKSAEDDFQAEKSLISQELKRKMTEMMAGVSSALDAIAELDNAQLLLSAIRIFSSEIKKMAAEVQS